MAAARTAKAARGPALNCHRDLDALGYSLALLLVINLSGAPEGVLWFALSPLQALRGPPRDQPAGSQRTSRIGLFWMLSSRVVASIRAGFAAIPAA